MRWSYTSPTPSSGPAREGNAMKFAMRQFGLVALAAGFLTLGLSSDASAQRKLSFAYDQPVTTAYGIAANIFDEKLKALSGGKLSINQFPGAQLGTEPQTLQKLRAGDIDFVITATATQPAWRRKPAYSHCTSSSAMRTICPGRWPTKRCPTPSAP